MYCTYCGRKNDSSCNCLSHAKISRVEGSLILLGLTSIPFISLAYMEINGEYIWSDFLRFNSLGLSFYLIALSVLTLFLKRSYLALFFGCHQKIERTIKIFKKPLNICARCTGIYLGILLSNVFFIYQTHWSVSLILLTPLFLDGILQQRSSYASNNLKRIMSGILSGPGIILIFTGFHHMIIISIQYFL